MTERRRRLAWLLRALAAALALWGLVIEPARLVERSVDLRVDRAPSLTIALLSDIHAGCNFVDRERLRSVVATLNGWKPDLIALLGDYVTENRFATPIPPGVTAKILGDLRAPAGVFAVLGNHDWWHDGAGIRAEFEQAGLRVLDGEATQVDVRGQRFWVLGVPDATTRPSQVQSTIAKIPSGGPVLALTHSPDVFPLLPPQVRLTLAGHTHGGQVALPLLGRPIVPSRYGQRYAYGHVVENDRHLYVTSGLGMSILPIRFGVPPEVVLLRVNAPP